MSGARALSSHYILRGLELRSYTEARNAEVTLCFHHHEFTIEKVGETINLIRFNRRELAIILTLEYYS